MNIRIYQLIAIFHLLFFSEIKAQSSFQFGILPAINLNKKLENNWKVNLKLESRQLLKEGNWRDENETNYEYVLTDIALVVSKKVGLNNSLAGGYLLRIRDNQIFHRLIQQFAYNRQYSSLRLTQRFSTDQTFANDVATTWRFRYRIGAEFPLNGQSVDPQEFYLKINHEYLGALEEKEWGLELRLVPLLGYEFNDNNKLETGLDYRLDSFINGDSRHRFWINVNWFLAF